MASHAPGWGLLMPTLSMRPGVHQSGKAVVYEFVLPGSMRPVTTAIALPSDAMAPWRI